MPAFSSRPILASVVIFFSDVKIYPARRITSETDGTAQCTVLILSQEHSPFDLPCSKTAAGLALPFWV